MGAPMTCALVDAGSARERSALPPPTAKIRTAMVPMAAIPLVATSAKSRWRRAGSPGRRRRHRRLSRSVVLDEPRCDAVSLDGDSRPAEVSGDTRRLCCEGRACDLDVVASRAASMLSHVEKRSAGLVAIAVTTISSKAGDNPGTASLGRGGGSCVCAYIFATASLRGYGTCPLNAW